uniref:BRO1 domain-containing protein n=1 Tax=Arcella intermedia TaxID=1963864 RepID=A0A6B2KXP0_9EUKA
MSYFQPIDIKRISSDTTMSKPLLGYVKEVTNQLESIQVAINEIEKLRETLRLATEKKDILLDLHCRYYALLSSVERRIPISETEVKINFNWYDLYKQKKFGRYSINYEKACVLFNIASLYTQIAVLENLENTDGIKNACKYFRLSAGTFEQLKELLEAHPEDAVTSDLTADSLNLLSTMMLAQAQELFYMMALKSNMKAGVISKLAAQASDYYSNALDGMTTNLKSVVPKRWITYSELKRDLMKAVAQFQLGKEKKEQKAFGDELARYRIASRLIDNVLKYKTLLPEISVWVDDIATRIKNAERSAQKDNDMIYHETVHPEHKLPPLEKKVMVKSERIETVKLNLDPKSDPFNSFIPMRVRTAESVYSERKAALLRDISKQVEDQNSIAKSALYEMNLPGALEALETPHGIPLSLLKKMELVKKDSGINGLVATIHKLKSLAEENGVILDVSMATLDEEEKDDAQMRSQYNQTWTRTPSHILNANLRSEGRVFKEKLEHAVKSDGYIKKMVEDNQRGIDLLCAEQGQILQLLPETSRQDVSIGGLKQLLKQLDEMIFARETALSQMREMMKQDEIIDKLIKLQESEYEKLYVQELAKYEPLIKPIRDNLQQSGILKAIKEENDLFIQKRSENEQLIQRQQVLQEFELAFTNYNILKEHLSEGVQFYSNFNEAIQKFKTKCSDFVLARKTEKQDLLHAIQTQSKSTSTSGYIVTTSTQPQSTPAYPTTSPQIASQTPPPYSSVVRQQPMMVPIGTQPVQFVPVNYQTMQPTQQSIRIQPAPIINPQLQQSWQPTQQQIRVQPSPNPQQQWQPIFISPQQLPQQNPNPHNPYNIK